MVVTTKPCFPTSSLHSTNSESNFCYFSWSFWVLCLLFPFDNDSLDLLRAAFPSRLHFHLDFERCCFFLGATRPFSSPRLQLRSLTLLRLGISISPLLFSGIHFENVGFGYGFGSLLTPFGWLGISRDGAIPLLLFFPLRGG